MFHKRELMLATCGIAFTSLLAVTLFIWPNHREANRLAVQIAQVTEKAGSIDQQRERAQRIEQELAHARSKIASQFKSVPQGADVAGLIRTLSLTVDHITVIDQTFTAGSPFEVQLAATQPPQPKVGNARQSPPPQKPAGEFQPQAMPLSVELEASFDSIFSLLQQVESLDRLVRVATLRITCRRDSKQQMAAQRTEPSDILPIIRASIGLEAIFQPNFASSPASVKEREARYEEPGARSQKPDARHSALAPGHSALGVHSWALGPRPPFRQEGELALRGTQPLPLGIPQ